VAENCPDTHESLTAVTLGAGATVREVYEFAASHGSVVVGGAAPDVGIVGWFTGAGHGPLSSTYGMGADNALQVKVVTPTGDFVTANTCQNSDLFWAIRGGGGGTFGIVTEVTMRAYPSPQTTRLNFVITALADATLSEYFDVVAEVFSNFPRLKLGDMQGYSYLSPPGFGGAKQWTLACRFNVYDEPDGTVEALFSPIEEILDSRNGSTILYTVDVEKTPDFFSLWDAHATSDPSALSGGAVGSRLLPASAFEDVDKLSVALREFANPPPGGPPTQIQGHLVANSNRRGNDIAMNPAWRDAVMHLIVTEFFPDWYDLEASQPYINNVGNYRIGQLRELAPTSGAYFNEADPFEENWQYEFFNDNYDRLRQIKDAYDPQSVLWCRSCVGSELWEQADLSGKLCRAT
jgi:FAD/FMN-containing dehydrogenase